MSGALILMIVLTVLLIPALGLPLLLRPGSRIPDYLALALLGAILLFYAWIWDAWWMLPAAAALVAFVAWLDRKGPHPVAGSGPGGRTRLRLRLWLAARLAGVALLVGVVIVAATGIRPVSVTLLVEGLLLSAFASCVFRFSLSNAVERDRQAPAEANDAAERGPNSEDRHASPAAPG